MKQGFLVQKAISTVFGQQSATSPVTWKIFHRYQYKSRVEVGCDPHLKLQMILFYTGCYGRFTGNGVTSWRLLGDSRWLTLIFTATSATNDNQPYISFTDKITSFFFLISVLAELKMFICARTSLPQRKKYFTCKSRRSVLHHTAAADYWGISHEDHKGKRGYLYQASGNR